MHRHRVILLVALLVIISTALQILPSAAQSSRVLVEVTVTSLNVRSGPGTEYDVIGSIAREGRIQLSGVSADRSWYNFMYWERSGWISASNQFTTFVEGSASQLPVVAAPPVPTIAPNTVGTQANPVPIGTTAYISDEFGYQYSVRITDVLRGNAAWERIYAANGFNDPAPDGKEYILFFVTATFEKGEYPAKFTVMDTGFTTMSQGRIQDPLVYAIPPDPRLIIFELDEGVSESGWLAKLITAGDTRPLIVYSDSSNLSAWGAFGSADVIYFAGFGNERASRVNINATIDFAVQVGGNYVVSSDRYSTSTISGEDSSTGGSSSSSNSSSSSSRGSSTCPDNCSQARAWGLTASEAAACGLDRDHDGVACYGD
jgi:uncharacterized protein YraI